MAYPIVYPQRVAIYQVDDSYYEGLEQKESDRTFNTFLDAVDGSYCSFSAFGETGNDPKIDPKYPDEHKGGWHHPLQCGAYKPTNTMAFCWGAQENSYPMF